MIARSAKQSEGSESKGPEHPEKQVRATLGGAGQTGEWLSASLRELAARSRERRLRAKPNAPTCKNKPTIQSENATCSPSAIRCAVFSWTRVAAKQTANPRLALPGRAAPALAGLGRYPTAPNPSNRVPGP